MNSSTRQRQILELLDRTGEVTVTEACQRFAISPATARRVFARLAAEGQAQKSWGGLRRLTGTAATGGDMVPSGQRDALHAEAKEAIAREAALLVGDGDAVAIDGGTTTLRLAPYLANRPVRILTNSLLIAHRIEQLRQGARGAEVFLTGGFVYPGSGLLVGPQAAENLRRYHSRWAFLSVGGLDREGATNTNELVVESERALLAHTDHAVLLADASKWDRRDLVRQCAWHEVDRLITDRLPRDWTPPLPPERLVVASPAPGSTVSRHRDG